MLPIKFLIFIGRYLFVCLFTYISSEEILISRVGTDWPSSLAKPAALSKCSASQNVPRSPEAKARAASSERAAGRAKQCRFFYMLKGACLGTIAALKTCFASLVTSWLTRLREDNLEQNWLGPTARSCLYPKNVHIEAASRTNVLRQTSEAAARCCSVSQYTASKEILT